MFARARARGVSLIEVMVATSLLAAILALLGVTIRWAVRSHRTGEAHRQSIQLGREAIGRLSQEMATAISVGFLPNGGELRSGVVYPDYATTLNNVFSGQLYRRERVNQTLPSGAQIPVDRAYNRLIFTRPGKQSKQFLDSLSEYVLVEYLVPPRPDDANKPQSRLIRRTFRLLQDPLATNIPALSLAGDYVVANGSHFGVNAADPYSNASTLEFPLAPEQRRERSLVLELPREDDQIEFSVEHTQALAQRTTPLPRDPAFEPSLFTISVVISLDSIGNGKFLASHILSQQVTIKSGF